jgi:hypothetical protein
MAEGTIEKALAAKQADDSLCLGYLTGLIDGWKEGDEHGVVAAHFTAQRRSFFINNGDKVKVNTTEATYIQRGNPAPS